MRLIQTLKRHLSHLLTKPYLGEFISRVRKTVDFHGATVDISNPYLPVRVKAAVFWNIYESAEARLLKKWLPVNVPVVELGASLGVISKLIRYKSSQPMYCVEANPSVISSIEFNLNSVPGSQHTVIQKAIYYDSDHVFFNWNTGDNLTGRIDPSSAEKVQCVTLSSILLMNQLKEIALVMDIEGAEIGMIRKDTEALRKCIIIIGELHACSYEGQSYTVDDLSTLIQGLNFKQVARDGNCFVFSRVES